MYIVIWMTNDEVSDWECAETLAEAKARFAELMEDAAIYTAAITAVVDSTDYSPTTLGEIAGPADDDEENPADGHASEALDFLNNRR